MTTNPVLWQHLQEMKFESGNVPFGFAKRLARDNDWSLAFAERVIVEYKRFCYLAIVTDHEVTPSDEVDQAWHLHLTYTRHYWGEFTDILGTPLHHGPTQGTTSDKLRFDDNYGATKSSYEREFGHLPPEDIWPDAATRFGDAPYFRRINTKNKILLPTSYALMTSIFGSKRWLGFGALLFVILSSSTVAYATSAPVEVRRDFDDWFALILFSGIAGIFGVLFIIGVIRWLLGYGVLSKGSRNNGAGGTGCSGTGSSGKSSDGGDGGSGCGSGCGGGGCGGG